MNFSVTERLYIGGPQWQTEVFAYFFEEGILPGGSFDSVLVARYILGRILADTFQFTWESDSLLKNESLDMIVDLSIITKTENDGFRDIADVLDAKFDQIVRNITIRKIAKSM